MSQRKDELMALLDQADEETRALLNGLTDEDLEKKTEESNWTVGQVAGHIAQEPWGIYVTRRLAQGKDAAPPRPLGFLLNLGNWWGTRRFRSTSKANLLETWSAALGKYRRHVEALPEESLDRGGEVSGLGRMTTYEFVKRAPEHTREHAGTIRKALREASGAGGR